MSETPETTPPRFNLGRAISKSLRPVEVGELETKHRVRLLKAQDLNDRIRDEIDRSLEKPRREIQELRRVKQALTQERDELAAKLAAETATRETVEGDLAIAKEKHEVEVDRRAEAEELLRACSEALENSTERIDELQADLAELEEVADRATARAVAAEAELAEARERIGTVEREHQDAITAFEEACRSAEHRASVDEAGATQREVLSAELAATKQDLDELARELATERSRREEYESALTEARNRLMTTLAERERFRVELTTEDTRHLPALTAHDFDEDDAEQASAEALDAFADDESARETPVAARMGEDLALDLDALEPTGAFAVADAGADDEEEPAPVEHHAVVVQESFADESSTGIAPKVATAVDASSSTLISVSMLGFERAFAKRPIERRTPTARRPDPAPLDAALSGAEPLAAPAPPAAPELAATPTPASDATASDATPTKDSTAVPSFGFGGAGWARKRPRLAQDETARVGRGTWRRRDKSPRR